MLKSPMGPLGNLVRGLEDKAKLSMSFYYDAPLDILDLVRRWLMCMFRFRVMRRAGVVFGWERCYGRIER